MSEVVVLAGATLWALIAAAFIGHTAGRRTVARVAAALFTLEILDVSLSDLGRQSFTPVAHAFSICAMSIVPAGSVALLVLALRRSSR